MGAMKNDIAKVAPKLISRGVLLDIAALKGVEALPDSYEITEADVLAAEERQGVRVESGDILCIRTGWYKYFAEGDRQHYVGNTAGPARTSAAGSTTGRSPRSPSTRPTASAGRPRSPAPPSPSTRSRSATSA